VIALGRLTRLGRSNRFALQLGHNYVGTEHILLGLLGDEESVAAKVLTEFRASPDIVRDRALELLAGYGKG
jgi:ATP-dependent Clp protease ATP-binding subunit ClpC